MEKNILNHIGLIPDGNRRWAKEKNLPLFKGHLNGLKNFIKFCMWCKDRGIKILTVFCFSTENWKRTDKEVNYLMKLFEKYLSNKKNLVRFQKNEIKVKIIGQKEKLSKSLQETIINIEKLTKNNKKLYLNLAINYGGRWDILQAIQKIINKKINKKITEDLVEQNLSTAGLLAPDLIIRTSREQRFSNFLLWQSAYSEFCFYKKYWPDFTEKDLDKILKNYNSRQRRFGK